MGDLPRLGGGVRQVQGALRVLTPIRSAARLLTTSTRAWPARVWAAGLAKAAEDYVDAVYMVLAAAAHAQANAACDQVDGVYVVLGGLPSLGNSTRSVVSSWRPPFGR